MISRRTFLLYSSLTPFLAFLGRPSFSMATNAEFLSVKPDQVMGENGGKLAIEGWHEQGSDVSNSQLISLSSAWKSSWL